MLTTTKIIVYYFEIHKSYSIINFYQLLYKSFQLIILCLYDLMYSSSHDFFSLIIIFHFWSWPIFLHNLSKNFMINCTLSISLLCLLSLPVHLIMFNSNQVQIFVSSFHFLLVFYVYLYPVFPIFHPHDLLNSYYFQLVF